MIVVASIDIDRQNEVPHVAHVDIVEVDRLAPDEVSAGFIDLPDDFVDVLQEALVEKCGRRHREGLWDG